MSAYCGNYPEQNHTDCPSSVECLHAIVKETPAAPVLGELPLSDLLSDAAGKYVSVSRVSHPRDRIQSFTVGAGRAEWAGTVLADAGYFVHDANNYVVHLIP